MPFYLAFEMERKYFYISSQLLLMYYTIQFQASILQIRMTIFFFVTQIFIQKHIQCNQTRVFSIHNVSPSQHTHDLCSISLSASTRTRPIFSVSHNNTHLHYLSPSQHKHVLLVPSHSVTTLTRVSPSLFLLVKTQHMS